VHTDSTETTTAVVAEEQPSGGLSRRLIGAGFIGLAGTLLPRLAGGAHAATPDATPAPTTTAPPKRPQGEDVELLGFAQSVELAAAQLYHMVLSANMLGETTTAIVTAVEQSHTSFGQALNALLGRQAPGVASADLITAMTEGFSGNQASFLAAAGELEDTLVATHSELISQIAGVDGAELIASILVVEARHASVFADLAGETDLDALFLSDAQALTPGAA
jgi:Ferritin-like domain